MTEGSIGFEKAVCHILQSEAVNNGIGKHQEVEDMCNGALPQRGSTPQSNQLITCQPDAFTVE